MTTVAIIQARMTSSRLPGKVLAELNGRPMLAYMLGRVRLAQRLDAVWVATTTNATDDPVVALCEDEEVPVFRGNEEDVLGRFAGAATTSGADIIVRLTADCPLMDPGLIDETVDYFSRNEFDYVSNAIQLSYPDGLDIEIFSRKALQEANVAAELPFHREHVTPYLRTGVYDEIPTGNFSVGTLRAPSDFGHLRLTVDTAVDLDRIRAIAREVPDDHGWMDVVSLLTRKPALLDKPNEENNEIILRPATLADADQLLEWVNRPDSLANKLRTSEPIEYASHAAWLKRKLASAESAIWIAESYRQIAGQIRLDLHKGALEVDIYVDPACRGAGVGVAVLDAVRTEASGRWPGVPLVARVKPDNWSSRRLFAKAGFSSMVVAQDHLILHREAAEPPGTAA